MRLPYVISFVSIAVLTACSSGGGGAAGGGEKDPVFGESLPAQFAPMSKLFNNPLESDDVAPETALTGRAQMAGNVYVPLSNPGTNIIIGDMEADFDFTTNKLTSSATNFNEYEFLGDLDANGDIIVGSESAELLYEFAGTLEGEGDILRGLSVSGNTVYFLTMDGTLTGTRAFGALGERGFTATVDTRFEGLFIQPGRRLETLGVITSGEVVFDLDNSVNDIVEDLDGSATVFILSE